MCTHCMHVATGNITTYVTILCLCRGKVTQVVAVGVVLVERNVIPCAETATKKLSDMIHSYIVAMTHLS